MILTGEGRDEVTYTTEQVEDLTIKAKSLLEQLSGILGEITTLAQSAVSSENEGIEDETRSG